MAQKQNTQVVESKLRLKAMLLGLFFFLISNNSFADINDDLIENAKNGNTNEVIRLIKAGANVNAKNEYGETALMLAASKGHKDIVEILIKNGAKFESINEELIAYSALGEINKVKELITKGADVNANDNGGWTALMLAALKGHKDIVEILKKAGAK